MTDTNDKRDKPVEATENALQEELRREAEEGRNAIGDIAENKNLSGSSTWETLPEEPRAD